MNDRSMLTDHEGKFEFDQFLSANSAVLEVRKPGFYVNPEMTANTTVLRADQITMPIIVRLYPEALITGTLTASDGTPLPRVFVAALRSTYNDAGHQWLSTGHSMTNSRGEFRMAVPPGDYRIETNFSPRFMGSQDAILPLRVPSDSTAGTGGIHMSSGTEERFELHPIVSRTHTVSLRLESPQQHGFPLLVARSSDGTVIPVSVLGSGPGGIEQMRIALPSGTFTLMATLNRGDTVEYGEATVTIADQDIVGVTLRLAPLAPIPVQVVVDSESKSDKVPPTPQQLGLMLQNVQESHTGMPSTLVMARGNQSSSIRPTPGTYRFSARGSGQWFVKSATYGTTDLLQQDMTVAAGAGSSAIFVTVSDQIGGLQGSTKQNGVPSSAWVYAIPTGRSAVPFYMSRSNFDGSFNYSSLPPGSYQVISFEGVHSADYRDAKTLGPYTTYVRSVTVTAGSKATLDLDTVPTSELKP
jgi:hypothetical protein